MSLSELHLGILSSMLTSHAYREHLAEERYRLAVSIAPSSASKDYLQQVANEEAGHYQGCLRVGEACDIDLPERVRVRSQSGEPGIPPFETWLDVLLAHAFNDRAGYHVLIGIQGSTVTSYAKLAQDIVAEEEEHGATGARMLMSYYQTIPAPERRARLILHLNAALKCLGRPGTSRDAVALAAGLKRRSAAATRAAFWKDVEPILDSLGEDARTLAI